MKDPDKPGRPERRDFRALKGMDPAANWLLRFAVEDFLPDPDTMLIPLLLELDDVPAVEAFKALREDRSGAILLYFDSDNDLIATDRLLGLFVTRDWLEGLFDGSPVANAFLEAEKRIDLSSPMEMPERHTRGLLELPKQVRLDASLATPGSGGLIVAAIDDGFAFAHERFEGNARGTTRIEAFLDLGTLIGLSQDQIEAAVFKATDANGAVDEDLVYESTGLIDFREPRHKPLAWRASHGTHVLDLLAGSDPGEGGPPIVAVQLPSPVVARTTGELLDFYVWLGALFIRNRAGSRPSVINVSFGYDAGPHDGKGLLEKHLSRLADKTPRSLVVLPSGNAQLSRCHAIIRPEELPVKLDWIVQPEDLTHSIVEIWLPAKSQAGARLTLKVVLPDGTRFSLKEPPYPLPSTETLPLVELTHAGRRMGLAEVWERPDGRRMFRIAIKPTARPQPDDRALAPAGRWRLRLGPGSNPLHEPAHAWVQRDDSLYGYPQRGRQSYFDHKNYARYDSLGYEMDDDPPAQARPCPITRKSLLNAIASSPKVLVAGGFRSRDCRIATYSSGGPNTPEESPPRKKPDALLPSDGSPAHPGVLAAGTRSGARLAMDGTSVAAPQLARYVAAWMEGAADPGRPAVANAAKSSTSACQRPPVSDRDGHGRLDRFDRLPVERFEPGD